MPPTADTPQWEGSLDRLRRAGCPTLAPVSSAHMPTNSILVLDHTAINEVEAAAMEALTGATFGNKLIVPELALDFFDKDAKSAVRQHDGELNTFALAAAAAGSSSSSPTAPAEVPLRSQESLHYDKLQLKKDVLLKQDTFRVIVQRVDQYDQELLRSLNISARSYDTRLYVLCALYFQKQYPDLSVVVATSDPVVVKMASEYGILTCPPKNICECGELTKQSAARKDARASYPSFSTQGPPAQEAAKAKRVIPGATKATTKPTKKRR